MYKDADIIVHAVTSQSSHAPVYTEFTAQSICFIYILKFDMQYTELVSTVA